MMVLESYQLPCGTGLKDKMSDTYKEGLSVVMQGKGLSCVNGTRFYLGDGTELLGVHSFSMPESNVDSVRMITVTLALLDIRIE